MEQKNSVDAQTLETLGNYDALRKSTQYNKPFGSLPLHTLWLDIIYYLNVWYLTL